MRTTQHFQCNTGSGHWPDNCQVNTVLINAGEPAALAAACRSAETDLSAETDCFASRALHHGDLVAGQPCQDASSARVSDGFSRVLINHAVGGCSTCRHTSGDLKHAHTHTLADRGANKRIDDALMCSFLPDATCHPSLSQRTLPMGWQRSQPAKVRRISCQRMIAASYHIRMQSSADVRRTPLPMKHPQRR